jgi:hypothetical protein
MPQCPKMLPNRFILLAKDKNYSMREIYNRIRTILRKLQFSLSVSMKLMRTLTLVINCIECLRSRCFFFYSDAFNNQIGSACYTPEKVERRLGSESSYGLLRALFMSVSHLESV